MGSEEGWLVKKTKGLYPHDVLVSGDLLCRYKRRIEEKKDLV